MNQRSNMTQKINVKMTKVIKIAQNGRAVSIMIDGQMMGQVSKLKYLEDWNRKDGRCETEIRIERE